MWTPTLCALYVDGQLVVSSPIGQLVFDPAGLFTFGADRLADGSVDVPMTGRLDEVKIFDRVLGQAESRRDDAAALDEIVTIRLARCWLLQTR